MKYLIYFFLLLITLVFPVEAQNRVPLNNELNVFIECHRCDMDYLRKEIPIVNFMRDRKDADVHVLFTDQRNAGRGREYTVYFIGQNKFATLKDTVVFNTTNIDSEDDIRKDILENIKLGLVNYILQTDLKTKLNISFKEDEGTKTYNVVDDWDYWVFRINANGSFNGEEARRSMRLQGGVSANRTTEDLKLNFSFSGNYSEDKYDHDSLQILNASRRLALRSSVIFAIDDHWSWGFRASVHKSTYRNLKLKLSFEPQIEYNVFPYSEFNKRQLRVEYRITNDYSKYLEETIYFKTKEFLVSQELEVSFEIIEPWGNIRTSLEGSNYFNDFNKNLLELSSNLDIKLFKGLSLNLWGRISRIRNQISLPIGSASIDEVLLERKELETQYSYHGSVGVSYSFGSIYNNVVNPRFGD